MDLAFGHLRWNQRQFWRSTPLEMAAAIRWDVRRDRAQSDALSDQKARAQGRLTKQDRNDLIEFWREKTGTEMDLRR